MKLTIKNYLQVKKVLKNYKEYMESLRMKKDTQELGEETLEEQKDTQLLDSIEAQQAEQQRGLKNKTQEKN